MSNIEGKPISTYTFEFEVSANAVTSMTRYQEEQTIMKTLKNRQVSLMLGSSKRAPRI